ncbi:MAG: RDD family protein [Bacillota bacterium]|nr:RDD family protein [Bacillota bacterium]
MTDEGFILNEDTGRIDEILAPSEESLEPTRYRLAVVRARVAAFLIDLIIVGLSNLVLMTYCGFGAWEHVLSVNSLFLGLTASIYFILFTRYYAQTPGKMLLRIKVVKKDGSDMDWKTVMIRELFGKIVSQLRFFYLGYLYCIFSRTNQCWHDLFADTYVIKLTKAEKNRYVTLG